MHGRIDERCTARRSQGTPQKAPAPMLSSQPERELRSCPGMPAAVPRAPG